MLPPSQCPLEVARTLTSDPAYFEKAEHLRLVIFWGVGVDRLSGNAWEAWRSLPAILKPRGL